MTNKLEFDICPRCKGTGSLLNMMLKERPCTECKGKGKIKVKIERTKRTVKNKSKNILTKKEV